MDLRDVQKEAYETGVRQGFYDEEVMTSEHIPAALAYIHSELSEALEAWRDGRPLDEVVYQQDAEGLMKPEGFPVELADVIIWIASLSGAYNIDLTSAVMKKLIYNQDRARHHGRERV